MYQAKPLGINIKANDYDVPDGFLRESINLQWRDGAFRPVPERLISTINVSGYSNIIFHKVSDENQINVLGFKTTETISTLSRYFNETVKVTEDYLLDTTGNGRNMYLTRRNCLIGDGVAKLTFSSLPTYDTLTIIENGINTEKTLTASELVLENGKYYNYAIFYNVGVEVAKFPLMEIDSDYALPVALNHYDVIGSAECVFNGDVDNVGKAMGLSWNFRYGFAIIGTDNTYYPKKVGAGYGGSPVGATEYSAYNTAANQYVILDANIELIATDTEEQFFNAGIPVDVHLGDIYANSYVTLTKAGGVISDLSILGNEGIGQLNVLFWFGKIIDGVYSAITPVNLILQKTAGISFTIMNGLLYFMGDGSSAAEQYYYRFQYIESSGSYESKDMYAWKTLIPFYPFQTDIEMVAPANTKNVFSRCGMILIRYAVVLKSGEVVLHSPIYPFALYGLNRSTIAIAKGTVIENIHTLINMDLSYADMGLFAQEISAINFYATTPFYESKLTIEYSGASDTAVLITSASIIGQITTKSQEPFYLIKTIQTPAASTEKILLTVGQMDIDITFTTITTSKIDISTIASGEIMPVDNFSYHKPFGQLTSNNGRIIINKPTTVLSPGHIRSLATENVASDIGFKIETEDGKIDGIAYELDKALYIPPKAHELDPYITSPRGILSYPDYRATFVGGSSAANEKLLLFKTKKNELHNIACAFNMQSISFDSISFAIDGANVEASNDYNIYLNYFDFDEITDINQPIVSAKYSSENRLQFSEAGEFSVWPALNSYRIGEGKIMGVGSNSVNPADTLTVAPLIVGTTDGVYTINLDPSGNNLVASITKNASIPYISKETLQVGDQLLFISDRGLIAFNGGNPISLTEPYFPDQGNGDFLTNETIYPNYNLITTRYFSGTGNPYTVDDIVDYLKDAYLAYDSRRETIWCSNPNKTYSLTYGLKTRLWGMNTLVFNDRIELFSTITTTEGDIYSRYLVRKAGENNLLILSGEDSTKEVVFHLLTRPLKMQNPDGYKRIGKIISRCEYFRKNTSTGYFTFGLWGKQDANKNKVNIPLMAISDISATNFPSDVRQDIPIGSQKGKYKFVTILQGGKALPESSISRYDIEAYLVDEKQLR